MRHKISLFCTLFCLLFVSCQTPTPVEMATEVATITPPATAVPQSPTSPPTSAPPATNSAVATAPPPTTPPTRESTVASAAQTPQNRQQFFEMLVSLNQQVIDDMTLLSDLLGDQAIEDGAWQDAVRASLTAVQETAQTVAAIETPQGGRQALAEANDAMAFCNLLAEEILTAVQNDAPLGQTVQDDLALCIFGLDKLNAQLTRRPAATGNEGGSDAILIGCEGESLGFVPLPELGNGQYQGFEGGLYPNGQNERPSDHEALGLALAEQIEPINGQIVLLSLGMSNTRNEFDVFIETMANDEAVNPAVLAVNGAIPGRPSQTIDSPTAQYWDLVENRLRRAGVSPEDVQVIWLKQAHGYPKRPFPNDALTFEAELRNIVQVINIKYPNVKQVFLSSRIYAGYAVTNLSPEPYAYQAGFGVKWLIEDQLSGDLSNAPWLSWGPYLWGDGLTPRQSDGLTWACDDFEKDGIHPATNGRQKVADLLLHFFKTDSTTRPWFLANPDA